MLTKAEAGNLELRLGLLMWVTGTQVCHLLPFQDAHEPEVSEAEKPGLEPGPLTWDAEARRDSRAHLQDAYSAQDFLLLLLFFNNKNFLLCFSVFLNLNSFIVFLAFLLQNWQQPKKSSKNASCVSRNTLGLEVSLIWMETLWNDPGMWQLQFSACSVRVMSRIKTAMGFAWESFLEISKNGNVVWHEQNLVWLIADTVLGRDFHTFLLTWAPCPPWLRSCRPRRAATLRLLTGKSPLFPLGSLPAAAQWLCLVCMLNIWRVTICNL